MREARAILISDYIGGESAASGGAGHAALDSYRALRAAGVDARLTSGFGAPPPGEEARFTSLGGADLRTGGVAGMARTIYNPASRSALAHMLADEDPETSLIILHQWTRYLSPSAIGLLDRFPLLIYMHDYFWACPNGAYYDFGEQRRCDRAPMGARCLAARCDREGRGHHAGRIVRQAVREGLVRADPRRRLFLHLSAGAMATAAPLLPRDRHAVIHNPLRMTALPLPTIAPPRFDVGYFGRLEPEKGVGDLVAATARMGLSGLFAGEGALAAEIARHPRLEHRAWGPRAGMAAAMRSCAVVVLPSRWQETWGLIVPEAMAAGVKVLVSSRAGAAELVDRFGGGGVFDPDLPGDLDCALATVLAMPDAGLHHRPALREALSPATHAARIVALAREKFGLDLVPAVTPPVAAASSRRASARG